MKMCRRSGITAQHQGSKGYWGGDGPCGGPSVEMFASISVQQKLAGFVTFNCRTEGCCDVLATRLQVVPLKVLVQTE